VGGSGEREGRNTYTHTANFILFKGNGLFGRFSVPSACIYICNIFS
jgi:hypothetical protein